MEESEDTFFLFFVDKRWGRELRISHFCYYDSVWLLPSTWIRSRRSLTPFTTKIRETFNVIRFYWCHPYPRGFRVYGFHQRSQVINSWPLLKREVLCTPLKTSVKTDSVTPTPHNGDRWSFVFNPHDDLWVLRVLSGVLFHNKSGFTVVQFFRTGSDYSLRTKT